MSESVRRSTPGAPFATLLRITQTYCHPAAGDDAYESLKRLARRTDDEEMRRFKDELRRAITFPREIPRDELYARVQYGGEDAETFLRRLWRDLFPEHLVPDPSIAGGR